MKTKTTFLFKSLIAWAFVLSSLGINNIVSAQAKQVTNTPVGDFFVNVIDGLSVSSCPSREWSLEVGHGTLGLYDFDLFYNRYYHYDVPAGSKIAKKAHSSNYHGDSIFYLMNPDGSIVQYALRGCPPRRVAKDTFKTKVPSSYLSGPTLNAILGDKIYVKESGWIMSTADTGKTWQIDTAGLSLGNYGFVISLGIDTNQTVWEFSVPGAGKAGLFKQLTNSNTWIKVPSFTNLDVNTVRVDANNTIWIVTGNDSIIYSTNGGNSWKGHNFAQGYQVTQTCVDAFGNLYALGATLVYRSADSGATWTRIGASISNSVYDTISGNTIFNDISADSTVSLATNYGSYTSFDHGNTWLMDSIPAENIYGYQQYPTGRKVISTALATYLQKANSNTWIQTYPVGAYYPYNASTGGNVWERPLPKIQQDASGHLFMLGFNAIGTMVNSVWNAVRSNDSGSTWLQDTLGMAAMAPHSNYSLPPYYVDSTGAQHLCINSSPALVYSKTLSGAWAIDTLGMGAGGLIFAEAFVDANGYLYAAGQAKYTTQYNGRVMRRPITGGSWVVDTTGIGSQWIYTLSKDSKGNIMASEPSSVSTTFLPKLFYRSAAAGKWNTATMPPTYHNMEAITGNNPGEWLAYTNYWWGNTSFPYYTNDGVYCSQDSGTTWNLIALDSIYIYQLETIGDTVFALTDAGLYKNLGCSNNITTNIQQTSKTLHSASVYPNPNNGNFTLEYNLPAAMGELRIMDVTGREVYSSIITIRQGRLTINASGLSEGIYFWQVYSGDNLIDKGKIAVVK